MNILQLYYKGRERKFWREWTRRLLGPISLQGFLNVKTSVSPHHDLGKGQERFFRGSRCRGLCDGFKQVRLFPSQCQSNLNNTSRTHFQPDVWESSRMDRAFGWTTSIQFCHGKGYIDWGVWEHVQGLQVQRKAWSVASCLAIHTK